MSTPQTLRQYQEQLLVRMDDARSGNHGEKVVLLGFVSGSAHYLIDGRDVMDVHQLSTLEPIPISKPWAAGAANIKGAVHTVTDVGSSRVDLQACKLEYSIVSPK